MQTYLKNEKSCTVQVMAMWYQGTDKIHLHGLQGRFCIPSSVTTSGHASSLTHIISLKAPAAQLAMERLMQEICLQIIGIIRPVNMGCFFKLWRIIFLWNHKKVFSLPLENGAWVGFDRLWHWQEHQRSDPPGQAVWVPSSLTARWRKVRRTNLVRHYLMHGDVGAAAVHKLAV